MSKRYVKSESDNPIEVDNSKTLGDTLMENYRSQAKDSEGDTSTKISHTSQEEADYKAISAVKEKQDE